jgi:DNA invertase Pin-like site-specific DNA recombinase
MMDDIGKNSIDTIVVYRLDRISRNVGDFAKLIDSLQHRGVSFISIKEQFDTSVPMGRAMMYVSSVFSQLERETTAERIRDNLHELAKSGRWLGGVPPTGYKSQCTEKRNIDGKSKKVYSLIAIPEEINTVKIIYNTFLETGSLTQVETFLLQNSIKTKNNLEFSRFTIRAILKNPVYAISDSKLYEYLAGIGTGIFSEKDEFDGEHGIIAYNKSDQKKGRANIINDPSKWIVAVGKHKGVIDSDTWIKVQYMLDRNKTSTRNKSKNSPALLSGILRCSVCGDYMRPKLTGKFSENNDRKFTYMCSLKERSRKSLCDVKNCDGNYLDNAIESYLKTLSGDKLTLISQLQARRKYLSGDDISRDNEIAKLRKVIETNEKSINSIISSFCSDKIGNFSREYAEKNIEELHLKNKELENKIMSLSAEENYTLSDDDKNSLVSSLSSFGETFNTLSVSAKRHILSTLIKRASWDGEMAEFTLIGN